MSEINVIIPAGGKSERFGRNKLFVPLGDSCVLAQAIKPFFEELTESKIIVALSPDSLDEARTAFSECGFDDRVQLIEGGQTRRESVQKALACTDDDCEVVLIHDGARPYVTVPLIWQVSRKAGRFGACAPALDLSDSLVRKQPLECIDRAQFALVQTPQGFDCAKLKAAYAAASGEFSDDFSLYRSVYPDEGQLVAGEPNNIKITYPSDLRITLTGAGYDIHRLQEGNGLRLGGINIPYHKSFMAHSDGDVALHALMDSLLSAVGEWDIGHQFPEYDPKYTGADSMRLLDIVLEKVRSHDVKVNQTSLTIIAQEPKLAPFLPQMREQIARALEITPSRVGINVTTNEKIGEIGAGNAIAAYCVSSLS